MGKMQQNLCLQVQIGAGNFIKPTTSIETVSQIEDYMRKYDIKDINEIIGKVEMNQLSQVLFST